MFSIFRAGVRSADPRPLGDYLVAAIEIELRAESLPTDTFSELEPEGVQLAKTASTLGFMNEMALELRYLIADAGGLGRCDINVLNHGLRRTLRNHGEYVRPTMERVVNEILREPLLADGPVFAEPASGIAR